MMIRIYMEYGRLVEGHFGIQTGPISSFETLKKELSNYVGFVNNIDECDLLHIHEVISPSALLALTEKKPYVIHAHLLPGDLDQKTVAASMVKEFLWSYLFRLYKKARKVIAVSRHGKDSLVELGVPSKNICVIGNGVDIGKFKFDSKKRAEMRERLGIKKDDIVVYSVGNILKRKGVDDFIKLASMNPSLRFIWFGGFAPPAYTGYSKETIEKKTEKIENIQFAGFVDDIAAAHCSGDIFCFPSLFENHPIVVLEAAACGRPLILRNIRAYDELKHGDSCFKANNLEEFDRYLKKLTNDENLRKKISKRAHKKVKKYDVKKIAKRILSVYEEVLNQKPT